jgi:hypothetical protein
MEKSPRSPQQPTRSTMSMNGGDFARPSTISTTRPACSTTKMRLSPGGEATKIGRSNSPTFSRRGGPESSAAGAGLAAGLSAGGLPVAGDVAACVGVSGSGSESGDWAHAASRTASRTTARQRLNR